MMIARSRFCLLMVGIYAIALVGSSFIPAIAASDGSQNRLALIVPLPDSVCFDQSPCRTAIDLIDADGSGRQRLLTGIFTPLDLSVSSDGRYLSFISPLNGPRMIFVVDVSKGAIASEFGYNGLTIESPSWSQDGKSLVFDAEPVRGGNTTLRSGLSEIYVFSSDGSKQRRLTDNNADDLEPFWSPDGQQIAFISDRDGHDAVYLMNANGTQQRRLTDDPVDYGLAGWSPDGKSLLLTRYDAGKAVIVCLDIAQAEQHPLTDGQANDYWPEWSPAGQQITFASDRSGNLDIYVMNADGTDQQPLTTNPADDFGSDWSPDGKSIAFFSKRDGTEAVYTMDADGSNLKRLNNDDVSTFIWLK